MSMDEGLTGGGKKPEAIGIIAGAKQYIIDFGALPTQVFWVLLLEVLNSYRNFGLRAVRYQYVANEWNLCDTDDGVEIPDCDTDIRTGWLLGVSGTVSIVASILGSMITDAIGVRKTALMALSIALVGRTLWTFGDSHFQLYMACFFFTPFGDALLSAGLYKVALKKLTPPKLRPFAFAVQYASFNFSASMSYTFVDMFRKWDDTKLFGMTFSGVRLFILTTWIALALALVIAALYLKDHTVIDIDDPEPETAGIEMPTVDINGVPLSEEPPLPTVPEGSTGLRAWRQRVTRKYRVVDTPLVSAGFVPRMQALAKEQGYGAAVKSAVNSLGTQFKEVGKLRNLWMVISFSLTTFFVSKLWGDMDTMMPPQMTRMYGVDTPAYTINSINTWGCMFFAPVVAGLTGPKEAFTVIMPGLWIMAASPTFLAIDPNIAMATLWIIFLTLGELLWSPRQSAWAATVAPVGREGVFVAVASIKDLLIAAPSEAFNGWMNSNYVPNCRDCRGGEMFCGGRFKNDTLIGCKTPGDAGVFCPDVKWELISDSALEADWCDAVTTCYQCQPENLMPGADLYETGWHESAREGWLVVTLVAMISPVLSWMILPFLRGEGSKETTYNLFNCGPDRFLGLCGLGGPAASSGTGGGLSEGLGSAIDGDNDAKLSTESSWVADSASPTEPTVGPVVDTTTL